MRILHVVATDQRRGGEILAGDVAGALAGEGIDQRVAVLRPTGGSGLSFAVPTVEMPRGWFVPGLRTDAAAVRSLRRVVREWAPDVVQGWGGEPFRYAVFSARGRPVVYTRIGLAAPRATSGLRRLGHRRLMLRAARIVAVADAVRRETVGVFGIPADRVEVIPSARDARAVEATRSRGQTRRSLGLPTEVPVVLSLGSLSEEKDPLAHLEVVRRARDSVPDAVHVVAGDGPLREAVEEAARATGPSVRFLGPVTETGNLLGASDVMLLASRSEGMPQVLIEAGMAGVASAAYAVAGVPELIVDGETGLLAPPGDVDALAGAVARLLSDEEARRAMGRLAHERCLAMFDVGVVAPRYLALYEELAAGRR
ncbi:MAG: glycosyltransferase family 4 protein [Actinomycetota bacterium]